MKDELKNTLFNTGMIDILLELEEESIAMNIHRKTGITYSYISKRMQLLKRKGLINISRVGRIKEIKLTAVGKELIIHIKEILKICGGI